MSAATQIVSSSALRIFDLADIGPWHDETGATFGSIAPAEATYGSTERYDMWTDLARLFPHNPQLTADPLPTLNQSVSMTAQKAALMMAMAGTAISPAWGVAQNAPAAAVQWDAAETLEAHPAMQSSAVAQYLLAEPRADITAIRNLYDRFVAAFLDAPRLETSYRFGIDHDTETPHLFLTLDTNGMNLAEVMRREMAVHEEIGQDPELKAATETHIITAV